MKDKELLELAREAGFGDGLLSWPGVPEKFKNLHDLAIAAEHKRLLAGSGEPVELNPAANSVLGYTAEQQAAAVLRERERCLSHAQSVVDFYGDADAGIHPLQVRERECASQIVAAIRSMQ